MRCHIHPRHASIQISIGRESDLDSQDYNEAIKQLLTAIREDLDDSYDEPIVDITVHRFHRGDVEERQERIRESIHAGQE